MDTTTGNEEEEISYLKVALKTKAEHVALQSTSPERVAQFLMSRGLPARVANEEAIHIWSRVQTKVFRKHKIKLAIGMTLISLGAAGFSYLVGYSFIAALAAAPLVIIGCAVLTGSYD